MHVPVLEWYILLVHIVIICYREIKVSTQPSIGKAFKCGVIRWQSADGMCRFYCSVV